MTIDSVEDKNYLDNEYPVENPVNEKCNMGTFIHKIPETFCYTIYVLLLFAFPLIIIALIVCAIIYLFTM